MKINKTNKINHSVSATQAGWRLKANIKWGIVKVLIIATFVGLLAFAINPLLCFLPIFGAALGALFSTLEIQNKIVHRRKSYPRTPFYLQMANKRPNLMIPPAVFYSSVITGTVAIFLGAAIHGLLLNDPSGYIIASIASFLVASVLVPAILYFLPVWQRVEPDLSSYGYDELKVGDQFELDLDEPSY
ncbi:hypothetical protein JMC51_004309 [Vibrio parahaemolyticus]|nr:hypothetical protein [Vibrio parahaemolyticus]EHA6976190.1 hypothetical protein [Vibrio parahaemolyticus]